MPRRDDSRAAERARERRAERAAQREAALEDLDSAPAAPVTTRRPAPAPHADRVTSRDPWRIQLSFAARLLLGALMLYAGLTKIGNLDQSVQSVSAYQLIPNWTLVQLIGYGLPIIEIILGLMLLLGLFTRFAAIIVALQMVLFMAAIGSAWARGLSIDCGCFGSGGPLDPKTFNPLTYLWEIIRDAIIALMALWLAWRPRTPWSLDNWLFDRPDGLVDDDDDDDWDDDDDLDDDPLTDHDRKDHR